MLLGEATMDSAQSELRGGMGNENQLLPQAKEAQTIPS